MSHRLATQIVIDVAVHSRQRKLGAGDPGVVADRKHCLPASRTGRTSKRGPESGEVKPRELYVPLRQPRRVSESTAVDPVLDRMGHREIQRVKPSQPVLI